MHGTKKIYLAKKGCYGLSPNRLFTEPAVHRIPISMGFHRIPFRYGLSPNISNNVSNVSNDGEGDGEGDGKGDGD